jgi:glyoxalase family protein
MQLMSPIEGLHHITAVAGEAQRNVDFYRNVLGQRLVKKTVNFDDPGTYHLYYADANGMPGSVLTFFPWAGTRPGVPGNGAANAVAYNLPEGALGFWQAYLQQHGLQTEPVEPRFGAEVLAFDDPDGLRIELIGNSNPPSTAPWLEGPVETRFALQDFHSVTLWLDQVEPTAALLTQHLGYTFVGQEGRRFRFAGGPGALGSYLDIIHRPDGNRARLGSGSIHHLAFRVPDDALQRDYQGALRAAGLRVTDVQDRSYFHSIYFREPGGVLLEIATATPGFATDEPPSGLGEALKLPAWLESQRAEIEHRLTPLTLKPVERFAYAQPHG